MPKDRGVLGKKNGFHWGPQNLRKWSNSLTSWSKVPLNLLERVEENHVTIQFQHKGNGVFVGKVTVVPANWHTQASWREVLVCSSANRTSGKWPEEYLIWREENPQYMQGDHCRYLSIRRQLWVNIFSIPGIEKVHRFWNSSWAQHALQGQKPMLA